MGKSKAQTVGYWYLMGLHNIVCKGPIDMLIAIAGGDRIAWSGQVTESGSMSILAPNLWGGKDKEGGIEGELDVMFGEATQQPNAYLGSVQGGPYNPAYRGVFGTVFKRGRVGAMTPYLKPWAYRVRRNLRGWEGGAPWYPEKAAVDVGPAPALKMEGKPKISISFMGQTVFDFVLPDNPVPARILCANPAHVIYQVLTSTEDGMSQPPGTLNLDSFKSAADIYHAEGLGLWVRWMQAGPCDEILNELLDHSNSMLVQDPKDLRYNLVPMRGNYDISQLLHFGPNARDYDVDCTLEQFDRSNVEEAVNEFTVTWNDSSDDQERSVTVQNLAAIAAAGGVINQTKAYACAPTVGIASRLAQRDLDAMGAMLARVRIRCNRKARRVLPGQVIRFSWPPLGIVDMPVRVLRSTRSGSGSSDVVIQGTEDVFKFGAASYIKPQSPIVQPPSDEPSPPPYVEAYEANFRDLVQVFGIDQVRTMDPMTGYVALAAAQPAGLATGFSAWARAGAGEFVDQGSGDFAPTATLAQPLDLLTDRMVLQDMRGNWDEVPAGSVMYVGAHPATELVRGDGLNTDGSVKIARGCVDTVRGKWPIGTRVWAYDEATAQVQTPYALGEVVELKAVVSGPAGPGRVALAPSDTVTLNQRHSRPYPPADPVINGQRYPAAVAGAFTLSWRHRDRFLQGDRVVAQEDPTMGPDAATRYGLRLRGTSGDLVVRSDIAGNVATVDLAYTGRVEMELWAINNDGLSWQVQRHAFDYTPASGTTASTITAPVWAPQQTIIDGGEVKP